MKPTATMPLVVLLALAAFVCESCGGGGQSAPTSPTPTPSPPPTSSACGIVSGASSTVLGIINGTACSTANTSVVLVKPRTSDDLPAGACSGTIIDTRAVLTAAHCLKGQTAQVQIFLGGIDQVVAESFHANPGYRENDPSSLDVGVVLTAQDLNRPPIPLLASRDARVEQAIIAGWGQDANDVGRTLRAGTTTISRVGSIFLETQFSGSGSNVCYGDSGGPLLVSEGGAWVIAGVTSAVSSNGCSSGTSFYANVRNPDIASFILGLVPNASRR